MQGLTCVNSKGQCQYNIKKEVNGFGQIVKEALRVVWKKTEECRREIVNRLDTILLLHIEFMVHLPNLDMSSVKTPESMQLWQSLRE